MPPIHPRDHSNIRLADAGRRVDMGPLMRFDYKRAVRNSSPARLLAIAAVAAVLVLILLPIEGDISGFVVSMAPGGDFRRELTVLQQFGSATTIILVAILIALLDRPRLPRMFDYLLAAGATWLAVFIVKISAGRVRPLHDEPHRFVGPFRAVPVGKAQAETYSWEFWKPGVSELWSMPSSHTALAVTAAVFLSIVYPKLRPLVIGWAILVALCRMMFDAHYPSDVVAGAAIAWIISAPIVSCSLGTRLIGSKAPPAAH
ncbi:MAG TPA: phosphatase PAP2 family protein [Phycisphaerales bacterium]|nr:phosphatase PAP2 family protein [Phycisphaerales bacterium]